LNGRFFVVSSSRRTGGFSLGLLAFLVLFAGQVLVGQRVSVLSQRGGPEAAEAVAPIDPILYRILSFGQLHCAVDWLWLKSLLNAESVKVRPGTHLTLFYVLDAILDLDPLFSEIYLVGGNLLAILQDDGLGARILLDKGERFRREQLPNLPEDYQRSHWPFPWQVPQLLGYVHLFELNDMPAAAFYFKEAASIPGAPPYLGKLQRRLVQPGGEYEVGLKLLGHLIDGARTPEVREGLEKKRLNLFVSQFLHELNQAFSSFMSSRQPLGSTPDPAAVLRYWKGFRKERRLSGADPWGGELSIEASGKVVTSTPHEAVFGLE
jgi:hypothetical protein